MRLSLRNRSTRFYFLAILSLAILNGLLAITAGAQLYFLFVSLGLYFACAGWFGAIIQLVQHTRGKSMRTLANGTGYYGLFIVLICLSPMLISNIIWSVGKLVSVISG